MRSRLVRGLIVLSCFALLACSDDAGEGQPGPGTDTWTPPPCYGDECDDPGRDTTSPGDPDDAADGDDAAWSPADVVWPPPQPELPNGPECLVATDCAAGWSCEDGTCVEPPDCHTTGTCDEDTGGRIEVVPVDDLTFSFMPNDGIAHQRTVNIYNTGDGPLLISHIALVQGTPTDFSVTTAPTTPYTVHASDSTQVVVTFHHTTPIPNQGAIEIRSNDSTKPIVRISLIPQPKSVLDRPEPCIQVFPTNLDFGQVMRGESKSLDFTVQSCGDPVLKLEGISRGSGGFFGGGTPQEFQLTPPPVGQPLLQTGMTFVQTVTFTGGLAGVRTGRFIVASNDPSTPQVDVNVRGESTPPPRESQGIHVELVWDSNNCDVDLHFLAPGGSFNSRPLDCYYANMNPSWGDPNDVTSNPYLDVDNVWGYGPENINLQAPDPGRYTVIVYYFSDTYGSSPSTSTNATIRIYHYGQLVAEFGPTQLARTGVRWDVAYIDWPSMTVTEIGTVN